MYLDVSMIEKPNRIHFVMLPPSDKVPSFL